MEKLAIKGLHPLRRAAAAGLGQTSSMIKGGSELDL